MDARVRVLDSYSFTYAFSLLPFLAAIAAMRAFPAHAYEQFGLSALLVGPPVVGLLAALYAERSGRPWRSTLLRGLLLSVLSLLGSLVMVTVGTLALVPLNPLITPQNFGVLTVTAIVLTGLISAPMVVTIVRELMARRRGALLRVVVLAAALAAIVVVLLLTVNSRELVTTLRKDQIVQLIAGITWFLPTYGVAVTAWRAGGIDI